MNVPFKTPSQALNNIAMYLMSIENIEFRKAIELQHSISIVKKAIDVNKETVNVSEDKGDVK